MSKYSSSQCEEFKKNPSVNPQTNRKIKKEGPTYMKIVKACEDPKDTTTNNKKNVCDEFKKNMSVNPKTGRKIKRGGAVYETLIKKCKIVKPATIKNQGFNTNEKKNKRPSLSKTNSTTKKLLPETSIEKTFDKFETIPSFKEICKTIQK